MASSINASTSGAGGVITTADNTGILNIQTAGTTAITVDASQNVAFAKGFTVGATAAPTFSAYTSGSGPTSNTIGTSATKVTYDTEEWDTNSNFASSRFTPTVAGYYQINAQLQPNNSYTGGFIAIFKNGSAYKYGNYTNTAVTLGGFTVSSIVYCNGSTDYIEIYGAFTTSQVTGAGIYFSYFNGCFLRSA